MCDNFFGISTFSANAVWQIFIIYIIYSFVLYTLLLKYLSRYITKSIPINGDEQVYATCCFRGSTPIAIAKRLNNGGVVNVGDPWMTEKFPLPPDWFVENCRREGITNFAVHEVASHCNLPFKSGHFDMVVSSNTALFYDGEDKHCKHIAEEFYRILKPGGKLVFIRGLRQDKIEKRAVELGITNMKRKFQMKLPFPGFMMIGEKPLDLSSIEAPEEKMTACSHTLKPHLLPKYDSWMPTISLVISIAILGGLCYLVWYIWPLTDLPKAIPKSANNRLNTGLLAGTLPFTGFAMFESFIELRRECRTGLITTKGQFVLKYLKFLVLTLILSNVWGLIWWLPSAALNIWVDPRTPKAYHTMIHISVLTGLVWIVRLVQTGAMKLKAKHEERKEAEKQKVTETSLLIQSKQS
eukprot:TRINITY_DN1057_c0_g1_i5.p1 TRINITY_DN1057_c0_g1~~TRINITY_DN1057_c0_g1_i5.p1  ORF type:complete len:410 (-),score=34.68 TRINITY_DN1057_c0_g1_i5:213-1442(-)